MNEKEQKGEHFMISAPFLTRCNLIGHTTKRKCGETGVFTFHVNKTNKKRTALCLLDNQQNFNKLLSLYFCSCLIWLF